LTNNTARENTP